MGLHKLGALLLVAMLALLAGCVQPPQAPAAHKAADHWDGRMALTVDGEARQSFSAVFLLDGSSTQGSLALSTPLGTVLAELQWKPGHAELRSPQGERSAPSLDALLEEALGSAIPVQALFAWLQGDSATAAGWQADLSRLGDGQLTAVRSEPLPRATLRIAVER